MSEADYNRIIRCLESATEVVLAHQGELDEGDIRVRHLLSIATTETKRQLSQLRQEQGVVAEPLSNGDGAVA